MIRLVVSLDASILETAGEVVVVEEGRSGLKL